MNAGRRTPEFYPTESALLIPAGVVGLLIGLVLLVGPMSLERKSLSDWLQALLIFAISLFIIAVGLWFIYTGFLKYKDKRKWLSATVVNSTEIVECTESYDVDEFGVVMTSWSMKIKLTPSQLMVNPNSIHATVGINKSQYRKYSNRSSVKIYSSREDPFVFILEDEV
jgi:hypothetical protein